MMRMPSCNKSTALIVLCAAAVLLPVVLSWVTRPVLHWHAVLLDAGSPDALAFFQIRLPRQILAFLVGAALSVAGVAFQSLLKNPLADPYILGVSGGAALGYVLGVALGVAVAWLPLWGFGAALASLFFIYRLAQVSGVLSVVNLLLIGVIFNSFTFALILVINAVASFGQAHQILYLLLGSIEYLSWRDLSLLAVFTATAIVILTLRSPALNALSLGDEEAFHLGVAVEREKKILFFCTSLLVGAAVSLCGLIGFVGLFVPHVIRLVFGADHRIVLPAAALGGGVFLALSDFLARHVLMWKSLQTHLPVGVLTALIGAPVFVWLLKRQVMRGC